MNENEDVSEKLNCHIHGILLEAVLCSIKIVFIVDYKNKNTLREIELALSETNLNKCVMHQVDYFLNVSISIARLTSL